MAELFPTPLRMKCAQRIAEGLVKSYAWSNDSWVQYPDGGEEGVTRHANELLRAELALKPEPEVVGDNVTLELTDAGRKWLAAALAQQPLGPRQPVLCRAGHPLADCSCQVIPESAS